MVFQNIKVTLFSTEQQTYSERIYEREREREKKEQIVDMIFFT
jgi:hypothetical protein